MEPISTLLRIPLLPLFTLSGPILIAILVVLFWVRAGSIFSLLERVWSFIAGKAEVSDTILREFIQETRDIERFRFMYGFRAETMTEVHKMRDWFQTNSIGVNTAQRAKRWINTESASLAPRPKHYLMRRAIALPVCAMVAVMLISAATSQMALLQMKGSERWFLADASSAKEATVFGGWVIEQSDCLADTQKISKASGFTQSEASMLCAAFKDDSLKKIVSDTVKAQRVFGGLYGFVVLILGAMFFVQIDSVIAAKKIQEKIDKAAEMGISNAVAATELKITANKRTQRQDRTTATE